MIAGETNEIRELTGANLDLATGGSITDGVKSVVTWTSAVAVIVYAGAYALTANADYNPDPWG